MSGRGPPVKCPGLPRMDDKHQLDLEKICPPGRSSQENLFTSHYIFYTLFKFLPQRNILWSESCDMFNCSEICRRPCSAWCLLARRNLLDGCFLGIAKATTFILKGSLVSTLHGMYTYMYNYQLLFFLFIFYVTVPSYHYS